MKSFGLLLLILATANAVFANARDWKAARVVDSSETDISGQMRGSKNTVHYTIETEERLYYLDYTYKPSQENNGGAPSLAVNVMTKIAVSGKHAYILDANGKELKMQIVKKPTNK